MRLDELQTLACVSCGRRDALVTLAASLWPNARGCASCVAKYGASVLAHAADEVLAGAGPAQAVRAIGGGRCLHCGHPTLAGPDGLQAAWCSECEAERRRLLA